MRHALTIILSLSLFTLSNAGETLTGRAVKVADGDTFTLLDNTKTQHKVRLTRIDTPEMGQAYSQKAKDALGALLKDKAITVKTSSKDRYGRVLGEVFVDGVNVNEQLVANGFAWHYVKYDKGGKLATTQKEAMAKKLGLWAESNPIAPWDYRANKKTRSSVKKGEAVYTGYWLNTSSNSRHNSSCRWYKKSKRGRSCSSSEGKPCGQCGG